jgi:hypothetical protein
MKKSNEGWTCYLKTDIGRQVLRFSLALSAASLVAGIALLLQIQPSSAQRRPQPEILPSDKIGSPQFDPLAHFLTFNGKDDAMSACLYYKAIKAIGADSDCAAGELRHPISFTQWKILNGLADNPGFDDTRTGEASALYFNAVDLALVRSMHGKKSGLTTAYYVCNYIPSTLDREGILEALEKARRDPRNSNAAACVAFDFSGNPPFTKFYIFKNEPMPGSLAASANLDGHIGQKQTADGPGEKFVPGLCKACHGADNVGRGKFTVNDPPDIGAHFLPFDLDNFDYLDDSRLTRRAQESKFKRLNEMILATEPPLPTPSVIRDLINNWYKGGRIEQDSEFIPPEWMENEQLYRRVVKPSCRTCHVALQPNFATLEDFRAEAKLGVGSKQFPFGLLHTRVCANAPTPPDDMFRSMPNSKVTFDQFWLSRVQGTVLERFLRDALMDPSITCPPPQLVKAP